MKTKPYGAGCRVLGLDETLDKLNATLDKLLRNPRSRSTRTILTQPELAAWKLTEPSYDKPIAHPTKLTQEKSDEDLTEPTFLIF